MYKSSYGLFGGPKPAYYDIMFTTAVSNGYATSTQ